MDARRREEEKKRSGAVRLEIFYVAVPRGILNLLVYLVYGITASPKEYRLLAQPGRAGRFGRAVHRHGQAACIS
jgi:hypothetical protein